MAERNEINLEPRVSILEKGQEAIQKELLSLSTSVKHQGEQLSSAILKLSENQNISHNALAEKIGNISKTDWQSFWSMVAALLIIVGGLMSHLHFNLAYITRDQEKLEKTIEHLQSLDENSIAERAANAARIDYIERQMDRR